MLNIEGEELSLYIDKETISARVKELAAQMEKDYAGKTLTILCILKGAFVFASDLMRAYKGPCEISFVRLSSYQGTQSTGSVKVATGFIDDLAGKDILIVEDIVDTGITMNFLFSELKKQNPNSVRLATCFNKPSRRVCEINPDYTCFEIEDEFIVGYGLDYDNKYRNLPEIYTK
jgi:hypoxanthine phosphoribosyltransferase